MSKRMLTWMLSRLPLFVMATAASVRSKRHMPVLLYHANYPSTENPLIDGHVHNVHPDVFVSQMRFLKKHFTIVPLEELFDVQGPSSHGKPSAAVTMDDGYASIFDQVLPLLDELRVPCSVFLSTSLMEKTWFWRDTIRWVISRGLVHDFLTYARAIDDRFNLIRPSIFYRATKDPSLISSKLVDVTLIRFLNSIEALESVKSLGRQIYATRDALEQANTPLVSIGNHTRNHYVLSSLTRDEQYTEIQEGHQYMESLGRTPIKTFSMPFSAPSDFNEDTLDIIYGLDYGSYLLSENRINFVRNRDNMAGAHGLNSLDRFMPPDDIGSYLVHFLR